MSTLKKIINVRQCVFLVFHPFSQFPYLGVYFSIRSVLCIPHYHEQAARVKLGLALAGCNGKNASKPRLVIDAGIMKEIRDDLEGGSGLDKDMLVCPATTTP